MTLSFNKLASKFSQSYKRSKTVVANHRLASVVVGLFAAVTIGLAAVAVTNQSTQETSKSQPSIKTASNSKSAHIKDEPKVLAANDNAPAPSSAPTKTISGQGAKPAQPAATTKPNTSTPPATKPAPSPAPAPTPRCPECGGDPSKTPTYTGTLIVSGPITITAGGISPNTVNIISNTGEAITVPYTALQANFDKPMVSAVSSDYTTFLPTRTVGFVASPGVTLGTYTYQLVASGVNGGRFYGSIVITIN